MPTKGIVVAMLTGFLLIYFIAPLTYSAQVKLDVKKRLETMEKTPTKKVGDKQKRHGILMAYCGDGYVQDWLGEECDDGNQLNFDACTNECKLGNDIEIVGMCGNGVIDILMGEECDDGNNISGDGCSGFCRLEGKEFCGDGIVQSWLGEECDDGNNIDGDGCGSQCIDEGCSSCVDTDNGTNPTDSVGNVSGMNYYGQTFSLSDVCYIGDPTKIFERSCDLQNQSGHINILTDCPIGEICQSGVCVEYTPPADGGDCVDTDGGTNPTDHLGNVSGVSMYGIAFNEDDVCYSGNLTQVYERICDLSSPIGHTSIPTDCPEGQFCQAGICVEPLLPDGDDDDDDDGGNNLGSCVDTDGGANPTNQLGNVSGTSVYGQTFNRDDSCYTGDPDIVFERSCDLSNPSGYISISTNCPEGEMCSGGICVPCDCDEERGKRN
jgi:cysteine-rich repeat protein